MLLLGKTNQIKVQSKSGFETLHAQGAEHFGNLRILIQLEFSHLVRKIFQSNEKIPIPTQWEFCSEICLWYKIIRILFFNDFIPLMKLKSTNELIPKED